MFAFDSVAAPRESTADSSQRVRETNARRGYFGDYEKRAFHFAAFCEKSYYDERTRSADKSAHKRHSFEFENSRFKVIVYGLEQHCGQKTRRDRDNGVHRIVIIYFRG